MKRILFLPARFNERLTDNHSRIFKIILLGLVLVTGLYTREYRGDYQTIVNNNAGGIFYVLFGSLFISILFPSWKEYAIASLAFAFACMIEVIQYFHFPFMAPLANNKVTAYLFGSSFNPTDFIFYAIGAVCAWGVLVLIRKNEKENYEL